MVYGRNNKQSVGVLNVIMGLFNKSLVIYVR